MIKIEAPADLTGDESNDWDEVAIMAMPSAVGVDLFVDGGNDKTLYVELSKAEAFALWERLGELIVSAR